MRTDQRAILQSLKSKGWTAKQLDLRISDEGAVWTVTGPQGFPSVSAFNLTHAIIACARLIHSEQSFPDADTLNLAEAQRRSACHEPSKPDKRTANAKPEPRQAEPSNGG